MQRRHLLVLAGSVLVVIGVAGVLWKGVGNPTDTQTEGDRRKTSVTTVEAKTVDFPIRRQAIALIESPATVTVLSRIDSQMVEQHVRDGQLVKKGDLLFVLDDREVKAAIARDQATIAKDEALLDQTLADLKRAQELLAKNSASQQQVDQALANQKSAAAVLAAEKATLEAKKLKLSYTQNNAHISVSVGTVRVTPGNLVKANDSNSGGLVTITQVQPLRVAFALPEKDLPLLRQATAEGQQPVVRVVAPTSGTKTEAKLDFIDNMVDANSGTITAKASFDNEQGLFWPGQYVQVDAMLGSIPNVILIPTVAVQLGQKGAYVFVVNEKSMIDIRDVEVLGADNVNSAVSGLKPGERVVIEGQNRLAQGSFVNQTLKDATTDVKVQNGQEVQK